MKLIEHRKIWDLAPHNAFTDLCRFQDRWYCSFREGESHVSGDGKTRVLVSDDGDHWESQALLESPRDDLRDLRDAKLSVTPDNRLMMVAVAARPDSAPITHQPLVWFCEDGQQWSDPLPIGEPNFWLWRVTWHRGIAYATGYGTSWAGIRNEGPESVLRFYQSHDGIHFETVVSELLTQDRPNESTLRFEGDRLLCLTRRETGSATAFIGQSAPPYTDWQWEDLGVHMGGPNFIQIPDGRFAAGGRLHHGEEHMALCWLDVERGTLQEVLRLPSGGDCSYAGLVWHEDKLWVSYYSSHEGRTSIYLAKITI